MGLGEEKSKKIFFNLIKLFELGKTSGYSFKYFSKEKYFTKTHIVEELSKIPEAKLYIPDDINAISLSRDYLFAVS